MNRKEDAEYPNYCAYLCTESPCFAGQVSVLSALLTADSRSLPEGSYRVEIDPATDEDYLRSLLAKSSMF